MLLLLARVELSLPSLGTLDRRFGDIDHHFGFAKASQQLFFARQAELPGLHQTVFEPMDNAANGSFTDSSTAGDVKVSAVLVPILQCHQHPILKSKLWLSPRLWSCSPKWSERVEDLLKCLGLYSEVMLAVLRGKSWRYRVIHHQDPVYVLIFLFFAPFSDSLKSNLQEV